MACAAEKELMFIYITFRESTADRPLFTSKTGSAFLSMVGSLVLGCLVVIF